MGAAVFAAVLLQACSAEVGSQAWCQQLEKKDKSEWSATEAGDYAKHCIFGDVKTD
ncbi:DUF3012 domain-containing protein [Neiella marina]|uniref:DUF3012 domain-containing protein n=2 Tax=Neiella holothuriorum TaxID=2870530 RepID=A0ABS7ECK1_9GAMM|nr:DUF3012 domain-containing protein [Neiella holothuriorum]